jgi:hypothetical protein
MLPTRWPQSSMGHRFRGWRSTPHNPSPQRKSRSNASKTSLVPSCTMRKQLTQHFSLHSAPLQHAKAMAHRQWLMHVTNYSTMLLHIPMQAFDTRRATWYCWYTRTCHTFPNPVVKVEQQVISTYPIASSKTSPMEPFSPCLPSSNTSCCQLQSQNSTHFTMAASLPPHLNHTRGTWPLPTDSHSHHHRQHHCPRPHNGNNDSQGLQINGSTLSLAQMLTCATPIPVSLAEGYPQLRQLLQQTSCTKTSSKCMPIFCF